MGIFRRLVQGPTKKYGAFDKFHPRNLVGKDRFGNEFYEWEHPKTKKVHREVFFSNDEKHKEHIVWPAAAIGDISELQLEWKAWLSFSRQDPPTEELSQELDRERAYRVKKSLEVAERERLEEVRNFGNYQKPSMEYVAHYANKEVDDSENMEDLTDEQIRYYNEALKSGKKLERENYTPPHVDISSLQSDVGDHYPSEKLARDYRMDVHQSQLDTGKDRQTNVREDLRGYSNSRTSKFLGVVPQRRIIKHKQRDKDEL